MAVYGGPDIVTDGLVLHLDAANLRSYFGYWSPYLSNGANAFDGTLTTAAGGLGGSTGPFTYNFVHPRPIVSARMYVAFGATSGQVGSATDIFLVNGIDVTQKVKNAGFYLTSGWIDITDEAKPFLNSLQFKTVIYVTNAIIFAIEINDKILTGNYDGTIWNDLSGNENNGTFVNGVSYGSSNYGVMSFDGVNDYVDLKSTVQFNTNDFTIAGWFKSNSANSNFKEIWNSGYNGGQPDVEIAIATNNFLYFYIRPPSPNGAFVNTSYSVDDNIWRFFTAVKTSTNIFLYINGILESSLAGSFTSDVDVADIIPRIGNGLNNINNRYYNGMISDLLVYSKALSAVEIIQNFEAVKGRYGL